MTAVTLRLDGQGHSSPDTAIPLNRQPDGHNIIWTHLNYCDPADVNWLTRDSALPALVTDALLAQETRPRCTAIGDALLIALRGVNLNPGANPDDMVSIRLWIDGRHIVSSRKRELLSVSDIISRLETGNGPASTGEFLSMLISRLVDRMSDTVDQFEDRVAELEETVLGEAEDVSIKRELATLRRQAITLRRYLAPQREAINRILQEKITWLDDNARMQLREAGDRLIRHIEDLDAVRERAAITQEELIGRLSEQLNSRMYILSVVAAIFLPLGFLTGLLGVNLGGIPGSENPQAFWFFLIALCGLLGGSWMLFRIKKWL